MTQKKEKPGQKISRDKYSTKDFENQLFSKKEQQENKVIEDAIHENNLKYKKMVEKRLVSKILDLILYLTAISTFIFGLMFLIAVIENLKF